MKIGLLTTYSFNYGSFHQAVALQKKLQDMGYECELINEKIKKYRWFNLFCMYTADPILPECVKNYIGKILPQYNSYRMINNDIKKLVVSPAYIKSIRKLSQRYDLVIVGSDELWSADCSSIRYCPEYFGHGWKCPLISYATCAVKLDISNRDLCDKIRLGLQKFVAISVRDELSKDNISKVIRNKNVEVVLDPTLLNPYFINKTIKKSPQKYILLYGQHYDEEQKQIILQMSSEEKAIIYSVGWAHDWSDKFVNVKSADELQDMFSGAFFCFPSTFHGTIFSILNHKQFVSMLNPLRGKKVQILLNELRLQERIYKKGMDISKMEDIDFNRVENRLNELRRNSQAYLDHALRKVETKV